MSNEGYRQPYISAQPVQPEVPAFNVDSFENLDFWTNQALFAIEVPEYQALDFPQVPAESEQELNEATRKQIFQKVECVSYTELFDEVCR